MRRLGSHGALLSLFAGPLGALPSLFPLLGLLPGAFLGLLALLGLLPGAFLGLLALLGLLPGAFLGLLALLGLLPGAFLSSLSLFLSLKTRVIIWPGWTISDGGRHVIGTAKYDSRSDRQFFQRASPPARRSIIVNIYTISLTVLLSLRTGTTQFT